MKTKLQEGYNGWANYETWSVVFWIQNDEWIYQLARDFAGGYSSLRSMLRYEYNVVETPDEVALNDSALNIEELDAMIKELKA
jgi:hypothetical protein